MESLRRHGWVLRRFVVASVALGVAALVCVVTASARPARAIRTRGRSAFGVALVVSVAFVACGLVGAAYAYDASRNERIRDGVRVWGIDVGGLTRAEARRRLARAYGNLQRPLIVVAGRRRFRLHPDDVGVRVELEDAISRALALSRSGSFLARTIRDVTGWDASAEVTPRVTFSRAAVRTFASLVEDATEGPPRAARVFPRANRIVVQRARHGVLVDGAGLRRAVKRALSDPAAARRIRVPGRRIPPQVTVADLRRRLPAYITVDRSRFTLRLYEHLTLTRTYTVSVGQLGFDTPTGLYRIQNKTVNPTWSVPYSPWTGSLAGAVVPPGPANPLKARWLGIYDGVGIHGTDQTWSLGAAASHGCIRMAVPDVIDLYERVDVGTPVYIG
jgi:lipoprotein-anchoring transpeptidase ErfK/SrfK